jgi:hypothetical protein
LPASFGILADGERSPPKKKQKKDRTGKKNPQKKGKSKSAGEKPLTPPPTKAAKRDAIQLLLPNDLDRWMNVSVLSQFGPICLFVFL